MDSTEQQTIIDSLKWAALSLTDSAEAPEMVAEIVAQLSAGSELTEVLVYLSAGGGETFTCYHLYPAPMSWRNTDREEEIIEAFRNQQVWMRQQTGSDGTWRLVIPSVMGAVEYRCNRGTGFTEEERALLLEVAVSLETLVVRYRDLHTAEMERAKVVQLDADLLALHDGSCDLSGSDVDEVGRKVVEMATQRLGFDRAGIFLVTPEDDALRGSWGTNEEGGVGRIADTVFPIHPQRSEELTEAAQVVRGDLAYFLTRDLDGEGRKSKEGDIKANLTVPMRVGERITGVLTVDNYFTDRPIGQEQVQPLMVLANQAAAALENMRLYQQLDDAYQYLASEVEERKKAEVQLQRAADELEQRVRERTAELAEQGRLLLAFQEIARTTLASLDQQQIVEDLSQQIQGTRIFRSLTFALVDEEERSIKVANSFTRKRDRVGDLVEVVGQHKGL